MLACASESVLDDPDLEGRYELRFIVEASGEPSNVSVATVKGPRLIELERCLEVRVEQWRFGEVEGEVEVVIPITVDAEKVSTPR